MSLYGRFSTRLKIFGVLPAPLTATPGMQAAGLQTSPSPVGKDMGKAKTHEIEDDADLVSDPESIISSEIEDAPGSPREQYSTASSSRLEPFTQSQLLSLYD